MKRQILLFALFLLGISQTIAQKINRDRVIVEFEDGSIFTGSVLEDNEKELKMVSDDSDTIQVNKGYTNKIRYELEDIVLHKKSKFHYTKGFFANVNYGTGVNESTSNLVDLSLGYRLNQKYSLGLGIGLHTHLFDVGDFRLVRHNVMPLYAYGRYYPSASKVRPFVDLKLGYGFNVFNNFRETNRGGFYAEPGVGLHFSSRRNMRFTLTLSQVMQQVEGNQFSTDSFQNEIEYNYNIWFNRTVLRLGIEFK